MNKAEIRPLLVADLEQKRAIEEELHKRDYGPEATWQVAEALLEARKTARLKRAQAELQLWLADRQWQREELEVKAELKDGILSYVLEDTKP